MKKIILLLFIVIISLVWSIYWNYDNMNKIQQLSNKIYKLEWLQKNTYIIPKNSFRVNIIQFWWLHSKLYDWVYRALSRWNESPQIDSSIADLPNSLLKIAYTGRKSFFTISCPDGFNIENCSTNNINISNDTENKCTFYFSENSILNSIKLSCINNSFLPDL